MKKLTKAFTPYYDEAIHTIGIGKKNKTIINEDIKFSELNEQSASIKKCKMLILSSDTVTHSIIIHWLNDFSYKNNCFAPIVYTGTEVLFFPQLRYQDSNLLKYLLDTTLKTQDFYIQFANQN